MRQWPTLVVLTFVLVCGTATRSHAAAKDESVAEWFPLIPSWFNDWRNGLADKGLTLGATFVMDNIGNPTGGMRQGAINFGRLDLGVDADLEKLVGWSGAKIHANSYSIYGRGLTRNYVGNLAPVSEIEALPDVRLFEAYIEQNLLGGALAIKLGQQAADVEFFDSKTDDLFVNNTFSWPAINASDLPAGGPASTIAAMGARFKYKPVQGVTAFAAIFNGTASDPGPGDPQRRDHHGLAFRVHDDPWLIGQVQFDYAIGSPSGPLAGAFTPGAWYHTGTFADQRFANDGSLLADPDGSGMPARLRGNFGIFATVEQTLYKPASVTDRSLSASTRRHHRLRARRLQPTGPQPDRLLRRRWLRCRRPCARPAARPLRHGDRLHAHFSQHPSVRSRQPDLQRPADAGAQRRDVVRDDLRGARQAGLAARAVFPICVPPLGRHRQSLRSDRPQADRRRGGVRPDLDAEVLRRYRIRPCRSGPAAGLPRSL